MGSELYIDAWNIPELCNILWSYLEHADGRRVLVSLSGVAGSGKTFLSQALCDSMNKHKEICKILPMDGYHYYRSELELFDEPELAMRRRGADFTFDVAKFGKVLQSLHKGGTVTANTFDHKEKDPKEGGVVIESHHTLILVEGLYLSMNTQPWKDLVYSHFDKRWFIDVEPEISKERVIERHIKAGLAKDERESEARYENNDKLNGEKIIDCLDKDKIDLFIRNNGDDVYKRLRELQILTMQQNKLIQTLSIENSNLKKTLSLYLVKTPTTQETSTGEDSLGWMDGDI